MRSMPIARWVRCATSCARCSASTRRTPSSKTSSRPGPKPTRAGLESERSLSNPARVGFGPGLLLGLDDGVLLVDAEHLAHDVAHLTQRAIGIDRIQQARHHVFALAAGRFQRPQALARLAAVTLPAHAVEAFDVPPFALGVHIEDRHFYRLIQDVLVDAHDYAL